MSTALPTTTASAPATPLVSVVIKALNEERRIVATIESVLRAVSALDAEVILADSCSTDRTVELAKAYPIRVVQLCNPEDRCCGVGPQLGYQHSRGKFVYIIDGDMELRPGFLEPALAFMASHPNVAGVAGMMVEQNIESLEYIGRKERESREEHLRPGEVDRLHSGGLYRRSAVDEAGYFSDRNLHSYEEFDLAVRLRSLGWRLWRLPVDAISHYGHDAPPYQLLVRRWRTGYVFGIGELVRAAAAESHLTLVFEGVRELRIYLAVWGWWAAMLSTAVWPVAFGGRLAGLLVLLAFPVLLMSWRKRSFERGLYAVVSWCFCAAGLLRGLLRRQRPAREAIASRVIREPERPAAPEVQGVYARHAMPAGDEGSAARFAGRAAGVTGFAEFAD